MFDLPQQSLNPKLFDIESSETSTAVDCQTVSVINNKSPKVLLIIMLIFLTRLCSAKLLITVLPMFMEVIN